MTRKVHPPVTIQAQALAAALISAVAVPISAAAILITVAALISVAAVLIQAGDTACGGPELSLRGELLVRP